MEEKQTKTLTETHQSQPNMIHNRIQRARNNRPHIKILFAADQILKPNS